jgi:spermidine/putrescine transport system permease protein
MTSVDIHLRKDIQSRWLLSAPALLVIFCAAIGPLIVVLLYSFMAKADYGGVKFGEFSFAGWFDVFFNRDPFDDTVTWNTGNLEIFWRSAKLSLMTTLATFIIGFPMAYFIATRPPETRSAWLLLVTVPFWTSLLIRTYAVRELIRTEGWLNWVLLKLGIISEPLRIIYTDTAVMIGMSYVFLPLMVLPVYASIERLDFRLVEAAYDLYAKKRQVLWRIILPLAKPGIIAGSILVFIPSLGAYVTPRILGGGKKMMLGNLIELQFGQARNWPVGSALAMTLMVIVMLALLIYARNASKGASHG